MQQPTVVFMRASGTRGQVRLVMCYGSAQCRTRRPGPGDVRVWIVKGRLFGDAKITAPLRFVTDADLRIISVCEVSTENASASPHARSILCLA